ncbi:DUF3667 domain-containing protein [Flaviaesturariibacter terrae]
MSHQPERAEKNCLNCGAEVAGRYCQQCGQENIVPHQTFGHLIQHFFFDLFHFDGKFFDTVRYLLFRPGRVPREYIAGRRVAFLDPIRMYLFTSAIFFLIFTTINKVEVNSRESLDDSTLSRVERYEIASDLAVRPSDSNARQALPVFLDTSLTVSLKVDSAAHSDSVIEYKGTRYQYATERNDSIRAHDWASDLGKGWLGRFVSTRARRVNERFHEDRREAQQAFFENLFHRLPYMLFVSLPFFALLLQLLYLRRKTFFYADHLVFTLYYYIFNFILLLAVLLVVRLNNLLHWKLLSWLTFGLFCAGLYYLYKGMRNFYGQSPGRTLSKFLLLNFMSLFLFGLLFMIFVAISATQF